MTDQIPENKIGYVNISHRLLRTKRFPWLLAMAEITPIHIERNYLKQNYRIFGLSEKFRPVREGEEVPRYTLTATTDENNDLVSVKIHEG